MKRFLPFLTCLLLLLFQTAICQTFTMEQVAKFSFPSELTSSPMGNKIAWAMNEQGKRNVYLAKAPEFTPEKLTAFNEDDGQEISSLQFSPDGKFLVFVRGGDHGGGNADRPVNPLHLPEIPQVEVWKIDLEERQVNLIGKGDEPSIGTPHQLIYLREGKVFSQSLDTDADPEQIFETRGEIESLRFSPNGNKILFVADRGDHSFIGIYRDSISEIEWIAPSFHRDQSPRWSPDGSKVAFIRTPGRGGAALPLLERRHRPWEIWIADLNTGKSYKRWKAPQSLRGSIPSVNGGFNLHWAADNKLVYLSYEDGWPHLYSIDTHKGEPLLLTPGPYHVEHVELSADGKTLIFSANAGEEPQDIDRRHIGEVEVTSGKVIWRTSGKGIEAHPVFVGKDGTIAFLSAMAKRPLLPAVQSENKTLLIGEELIPEDFPTEELVVPKQVVFTAPDGMKIHGQLFENEGGKDPKPAIVFVHGGPQRQMLLGWSYIDYYANTYAINQYLANLGFVVLSVNYRLGIGYGYEFHKPKNTYYKGAAEYQDIKAAGEFLSLLPQVDENRIGIYGGSYGGYLTALALGKDPDLFKAGVDIHGVHNFESRYDIPEGFEKAPDYEKAKQVAWESSPLAYLDNWKSPVLLIHGDDDRNVDVSHTIDLAQRLEEKNIPYEFLMIPGDTHHWMKYSNMVRVDKAVAEFLSRHLMP